MQDSCSCVNNSDTSCSLAFPVLKQAVVHAASPNVSRKKQKQKPKVIKISKTEHSQTSGRGLKKLDEPKKVSDLKRFTQDAVL